MDLKNKMLQSRGQLKKKVKYTVSEAYSANQ